MKSLVVATGGIALLAIAIPLVLYRTSSDDSLFFAPPSVRELPVTREPRDTHEQPATAMPQVGPDEVAILREALATRPTDGELNAKLALKLLAPVDHMAPNIPDDSSIYSEGFTLGHPRADDARKAMEVALRVSPGLSSSHLAHQAVLMAEGRAEEAIQPGRKALDINPHSAHAYTELARSHLLAACAQGCQARESLRREKKEEKKSGRKSALEQREREAAENQRRQEAAQQGSSRPPLDRGGLRAGAMWRIMEAGRLLQQAAAADPGSAGTARRGKAGRKLAQLQGSKVLSTEEVMAHAQCQHFFGQELAPDPDSRYLCDKKRYKYE